MMGRSNEFNELTTEWENTYSSLESIEADIWLRLEDASRSTRNDFHLPVVGTVSDEMPSLRTVVLRGAWANEKKLSFHTDIRSPKVSALLVNPSIGLLFYHKIHRLQLRVQGHVVIDRDSTDASAAWDDTPASSRRCYLSTEAPSSFSDVPSIGFPETFRSRFPNYAETLPGREYFAVVRIQVQSIDWLWLHHGGHRRAKFVYRESGFEGQWLVP
jgi:pyridoxine/pyridoxamine 5'-phosphate oxidase